MTTTVGIVSDCGVAILSKTISQEIWLCLHNYKGCAPSHSGSPTRRFLSFTMAQIQLYMFQGDGRSAVIANPNSKKSAIDKREV